MLDTLRPDPTFYPSPKLAMEAPAENYAYVLMLSPDGSQPDALGVVDVQAGLKDAETDGRRALDGCDYSRLRTASHGVTVSTLGYRDRALSL